jgi:hypothetical protein
MGNQGFGRRLAEAARDGNHSGSPTADGIAGPVGQRGQHVRDQQEGHLIGGHLKQALTDHGACSLGYRLRDVVVPVSRRRPQGKESSRPAISPRVVGEAG